MSARKPDAPSRDLGLRVFRSTDEYWPSYEAPGIGRVTFDDCAPSGSAPWLAVIDGDEDPPVYYATQREAKIACLATMVWNDKAFGERLHAELGDEGCPF